MRAEFTAPESAQPGHVLGTLSSEQRIGLISVEPLASGPLTVDVPTGQVRLSATAELDFETRPVVQQQFRLIQKRKVDSVEQSFLEYLKDAGQGTPSEASQTSHVLTVTLHLQDAPEAPHGMSGNSPVTRWQFLHAGGSATQIPLAWHVFDQDAGDFLRFQLVGENPGLSIDEKSGLLQCEASSDSVAPNGVVRLKATDQSGLSTIITREVFTLLPRPAAEVVAEAPTLVEPPPTELLDQPNVASTETEPTMSSTLLPTIDQHLPEPVETLAEEDSARSVPAVGKVDASVASHAASEDVVRVPLEEKPTSVETSSNQNRANSLLGDALILGVVKSLVPFVAIPVALYAAFFIYMRRRRPVAETVDELRIVEPNMEQFAISDHDMKELLWGKLNFEDELRSSASGLARAATDSLSHPALGVESTTLKPLPKEVIEAASREFRLSSLDELGLSSSTDEEDTDVDDEELDDITLALRELDELETKMLKSSRYGRGDVVAFSLPDGTEEVETTTRRQSAVSAPVQRGESTIEEWLRRVAPGYGNGTPESSEEHSDDLDFDSLDEGDRIEKERVVTEEYRRQLREEMESFRKVAISVAEIRILEEEDQEKQKSWSSVVAVAAGCLVIGGVCIVFNWFGQAAYLLGWPAVGVGMLILVRHLADWNAVWKRLHSRISTFQNK
ncbi:MAG: hypothetical protein R3C18_16955 [Planctomycetaceae bacterium]